MKRRSLVAGAAASAAAALLWRRPVGAQEPPLRLFVAASTRNAVETAVAAWRARFGDAAPVVSVAYGSSAALARQIELGAPADLFLSANQLWMRELVEKKLVLASTQRPVLTNRLVLAAAPGQASALPSRPEIDGAIDLAGGLGADGRLAIGRVRSVPLGLYGAAALQRLGLWESVAGRLAEAKDARAALAYVSSGATPLGVLYASDLRAAQKSAAAAAPRLVGLFPAASHDAIVYPMALTQSGGRRETARDLLTFLSSAEAQRIFAEYGFGQP